MDDDDTKLDLLAYKTMAESVERTLDRRLEVNNFFVAVNGAVAGYYAYVAGKGDHLLWFGVVFGMLACLLWIGTLYYYRSLAAAKFMLLGAFETNRSMVGYQREWEVFRAQTWLGRRGVSLSLIEIGIALIALVSHPCAPILLHKFVAAK